MIIDLHTRTWNNPEALGPSILDRMRRATQEPWERHAAADAAHLEAMEPVSACVVLGLASAMLGADISVETVAETVSRDPGRRLGFAGIDPMRGDPIKQLDEARAAGLVGVTLTPAGAGFHPTDTRAMTLFEACQGLGIPVLMEPDAALAREARMEFARPMLLDEVAREFPELKLVLGSMGHPWVDEGVTLLAKHPTVYADLAGLVGRPWELLSALLSAHQHRVTGQVLFGSGFPMCTPEQAIVNIYSVNTLTQGTALPSVPRELLRSIVERDTLSLLGLPTPDGPSPVRTPAAEEPAEASADDTDASPANEASAKQPESEPKSAAEAESKPASTAAAQEAAP